ncbi:hypothetical protein, partial [Streptomyces sp. NRRL S-1813]|uniref:hypothetical protein n=1 Tax=Streptomyces sp. NRRL S-1813 TaxID=1463888 RepID=UPI00056CB4BB
LAGPDLTGTTLTGHELSHDTCVTDPFSPAGSGSLMYPTGTPARWTADGQLELLPQDTDDDEQDTATTTARRRTPTPQEE